MVYYLKLSYSNFLRVIHSMISSHGQVSDGGSVKAQMDYEVNGEV